MKTISTLLFSVFFMVIGFAGQAQIISTKSIKNRLMKRAGQRVEEKATQKLEEGVDKSVDKVFDSLFGAPKKTETNSTTSTENTNSEEAALGMMNKVMSSFGTSAPPSESYNFSSSYIMNVTSKTKDGDYDMKMKYYFAESGKYMGTKMISGNQPGMDTEAGNLEAMIMDFEKNSMYTFLKSEDKKMMMGISLKTITGGMSETDQTAPEEYEFTKTGESKTIAGYTADAYLLTQDGQKSTVWISRSRVPVVSTYYETFLKMSNSGNNPYSGNAATNAQMMALAKEGRAMLGMDSFPEKGGEMHMEVESIKESDSFSFSTTGYENMMDMNKIMQDAMKEAEED